jgi:hypothetical protein
MTLLGTQKSKGKIGPNLFGFPAFVILTHYCKSPEIAGGFWAFRQAK